MRSGFISFGTEWGIVMIGRGLCPMNPIDGSDGGWVEEEAEGKEEEGTDEGAFESGDSPCLLPFE